MAFANRFECYVCGNRGQARNMPRLYGVENFHEIAIFRRDDLGRDPLDIVDNSRLCMGCFQDIRREVDVIQNNPMSISLNVLRSRGHQLCFICNADHDVHRLSVECKAKVFIECNIYFPENVRCCNIHLDERGYILRPLLHGLQCINRKYVIQGPYLQTFLQAVREVSINQQMFNDVNDLSESEMLTLTSLTLEQFNELFTYCDRVACDNGFRYVKRNDLLLFLCKLRQGLSDEFLTILFKRTSRQATSLAIDTVRKSLMIRFVPENIGLDAITRARFIREHVTEFANVLYNPNPREPAAIVYVDGTYSYCHKSRNFRVLRQTYSMHKNRHLIKPALMVAPDGYILDIHGPYFSDNANNDASMLADVIDIDNNFNDWFRDGDIFVVDRGYRDVKPYLEELGYVCKMPPLLERGENQLTTEDANESRLITKTRWIVEVRNGHLKMMFKLLNNLIHVHILQNVGDFYRIAGAIINRYHRLINMQNANAETATQMLVRAEDINHVQARVEAENLGARNIHRWIRLDDEDLDDFPVLTEAYLQDLTVGVYQIGLAPSYIQDTLQRDETNELQIEMLIDEHALPEPGLLRVRVFSRFRNRTKYQLWIDYHPNGNVDDNPINGYYCTCRIGTRTLGTCVHIASVLWYLGYARHENNVRYPPTRLINEIEDAEDRQPQINPIRI